jgi:hypothetical protein
MKDKDYNMLQEAYSQVNENLYGKPEAKFIEMEDGRQMRDLEEMDKQALFAYVMNKPQLKKELDYLIGTGSMSEVSKWIESLERSQNVISNGLQKSYLFDVCREELFAKNPRAKEEHEALNKRINQPMGANKPTISGLAKQDPREVEGYGKTYGEARDINIGNLKGKEWHGMGAKMPESPSSIELLRPTFKKKTQPVQLSKDAVHDLPTMDLTNALIDALSNYKGDVNYKELAKSVAELIKDQYGSHIKMDFLTALNKELGK